MKRHRLRRDVKPFDIALRIPQAGAVRSSRTLALEVGALGPGEELTAEDLAHRLRRFGPRLCRLKAVDRVEHRRHDVMRRLSQRPGQLESVRPRVILELHVSALLAGLLADALDDGERIAPVVEELRPLDQRPRHAGVAAKHMH